MHWRRRRASAAAAKRAPYPDAEADHAALLGKAGWRVVERIDVTSEFARRMDMLVAELHARRDALLEVFGEQDYAERIVRRSSNRAAIACGLLRRHIFVAACVQ